MAPFERDHGDVGDGPVREYGDITLSNGDVVIYSTTDPDQWIQSDRAVDFGDL